MTISKNGGKLAIFALVALIGGAAGFGYFNQTSQLSDDEKGKPASTADSNAIAPDKEAAEILAVKPNDIIIGDTNALVTLLEYSSLSCPHCARFHTDIIPSITKDFITTGKVKYVVRHFPLNEPALKGAIVVECAGENNLSRENFVKVLFDMQSQWAMSESFLKDLKQIALVGGLDSAMFDSCMNNKELENRILAMRKDAEDKLKISATPTLYIEGKKFEGEPTVQGFSNALKDAAPGAR